MASRACHGDFYALGGARFYRCLQTTAVLSATALHDLEACPQCGRPICGEEHGALPIRTLITVQIQHPVFGWKDHRTELAAA
jgi:hypothetical protein